MFDVDVDREFLERSKAFMKRSVESEKPFLLYFNHSLMHMPTIPRAEFKGKSGQGEWADCLLELDSDFGEILDTLKELGVDDNTIVVFSGDNGPEELEPWRGHPGFFDGSYFTGMEGSLRTPCLVRYPGHAPAGKQSNDVVHITDMFTTLSRWAGADIPNDRVIDGVDQRDFFEGKQDNSARDGFPYWMGATLYGVKWRNFKMLMYLQRTSMEPSEKLASPHIINLTVDPKERTAIDLPYMHSWTTAHFSRKFRMTPTHAGKKGRRYRYYVSTSLITGSRSDHAKGWRIPAGDVDGLVLDRLRAFFASETDVGEALCAILDEVVGPHVVRPLRSQPHTRHIVEPETALLRLFHWDFQPFPASDPIDAFDVDPPAFGNQHPADAPVAVTAVPCRKSYDVNRQCRFLMRRLQIPSLRRSRLSDDSTGATFRGGKSRADVPTPARLRKGLVFSLESFFRRNRFRAIPLSAH
jgi:arylsulfatase